MPPRNNNLGRIFTPSQIKQELIALQPLTGRPQRLTDIGADDILNLKITLETTTSIDDFIRSM